MKKETAVLRHYVRGGLLASYPRSGNTMVRMALHSWYGHETGSMYDESTRSATYLDVVGDCGEQLKDGIYWKTHERPSSNVHLPVIIVYRDPRDVFMSLHRFYHDVNNREYTPTELIMGFHPYGDWSEWVRSWVRYAPSNALWLQYEGFDPDCLMRAGLKMKDAVHVPPELPELREQDGEMFGPGHYTDAERSTFYGDKMDLLVSRHKSMASMLGYSL